MKIVYRSRTGFTERYATIIAANTGMEAIPYAEAKKLLKPGEQILYLGWVFGGVIGGYRKARAKYEVKAVCGVGISPQNEKTRADLALANHVDDVHVFYMQGGFRPESLKGFKKFLIGCLIRAISKKQNPSEEEKIICAAMKNGADWVKEENAAEIVQWLKADR